MTKKKYFFPKYYSCTSFNTSKKRLLHPFSGTVTVSISFSDKNIKYWKENRKNTRLRLKTLINNDFFVNEFQILP